MWHFQCCRDGSENGEFIEHLCNAINLSNYSKELDQIMDYSDQASDCKDFDGFSEEGWLCML